MKVKYDSILVDPSSVFFLVGETEIEAAGIDTTPNVGEFIKLDGVLYVVEKIEHRFAFSNLNGYHSHSIFLKLKIDESKI